MIEACSGANPSRPRLLLICFLCSPARGSEYGVGWNRAVQAARFFDTWVICAGGRSEADIREYERTHGKIPGLTFVFVPRSDLFSKVQFFPGIYYLLYRAWQKNVFEVARRLEREVGFDLVHQVNLCTFREPGLGWKLDVPFLWGPWGGTSNFPSKFREVAGFLGAAQESLRTIVNRLQLRYSPRVRRAAETAAVVMASTTSACEDFIRAGLPAPQVIPGNGIAKMLGGPRQWTGQSRPLRVLWSGVLRAIKALPLLLRALARLPAEFPVEVRVLGDGPHRRRLHRMARRLRVDQRITWLGWRPHHEALEQYSWADVFVFTSLRDNFPTVILEAFSAGLPVIALDHQGMKDIVTAEAGVKIAVSTPAQVVADLVRALQELRTDPARWESMSAAAAARAQDYLWPRLGEQMAEIYRRVLAERPVSQGPLALDGPGLPGASAKVPVLG